MRSKYMLIVLMLLCVMTLPVAAEDTTIGIGDGSGYVTIPIIVTNATNIGTVDITLSYDPTVVNVTHVAKGDMGNVFSNLKNATDGWIRIGAFKTGDGLNGAFILANVSFEPVGSSGSCPLEISVNEYVEASPIYNAMPYTVRNGTYTLTSEESYEAPSSRSNRDGTYPPEYPDEDDGADENVTEEKPPANETVVGTPAAPPVKKLPGNETDDEDDGGISWIWLLIVLAVVAVAVGTYLMIKNNDGNTTSERAND